MSLHQCKNKNDTLFGVAFQICFWEDDYILMKVELISGVPHLIKGNHVLLLVVILLILK